MTRLSKQARIEQLERELVVQKALTEMVARAGEDAAVKAARVTAFVYKASGRWMFALHSANRLPLALSRRDWKRPSEAARAARAVSPGCTVKVIR